VYRGDVIVLIDCSKSRYFWLEDIVGVVLVLLYGGRYCDHQSLNKFCMLFGGDATRRQNVHFSLRVAFHAIAGSVSSSIRLNTILGG
jgi:hypothetical protein